MSDPEPYRPNHEDEWLVIVDPQTMFTSAQASPWGTDLWPAAQEVIEAAAAAWGRERTIITRFVADPGLGGSWGEYFRAWPFAVVPDQDPLNEVVPALAAAAGHVVPSGHFGKWGPGLRAIVGDRPRLALTGVSTDCCVVATALPAADAGAWVRILSRGCAGSTPQNHRRALEAMALFGPQIVID